MENTNREDISITSKRYYDRFVKPIPNSKARQGTLVYISKEHHTLINKIIRIIGDDKNTIFGYLDNVLAEHFDKHLKEIDALYKSKTTSIL